MTGRRNYVDEWVDSAAAPIIDVNPSNVDDDVASHAADDAAQARRAIQSVRAAFASWARSSMVNAPTAGVDYHVPFGRAKASSCGPRGQGTYAVEFYTRVKTVYTNVNIAG